MKNSVCMILVMSCLGVPGSSISYAFDAAKPASDMRSFTQLPAEELKSTENQIKLFKFWALARCNATVSKQAGSPSLQEDWSNTASAYLEYLTLPLEANTAAESLVQEYLKTTRGGSAGGSYETMKCIDLFNSRALDALSANYVKK